jgi:hypothetical protein
MRLSTRSVNGHRYPMPHLSRRGDKRVEMGHRPRRGQSPLISSHMIVYSVCPLNKIWVGGVRMYVRMYVHMYVHMYI